MLESRILSSFHQKFINLSTPVTHQRRTMRIVTIFAFVFLTNIVTSKDHDIKIVEIGGMKYAQVQVGAIDLTKNGGKIIAGYLKTTFDPSFLAQDMKKIEAEYAALPILQVIPSSLVPDFLKPSIYFLTRHTLKFLPRFLRPEFYTEVHSKLQNARVEFEELNAAIKNVKIKPSPIKAEEKVMEMIVDHKLLYENNYDFATLKLKDSSSAEEKLLFKIGRTITAMETLKKLLSQEQFDLTFNKRMEANIKTAIVKLMTKYNNVSIVNVNVFEITITGVTQGKFETMIRIPLVYKPNVNFEDLGKKTKKTKPLEIKM